MATFRDTSKVPGRGGGGVEARAVGARTPRKRWPFVGQLQGVLAPRTAFLSPLLHFGKNLVKAGKDSESLPASFSNLRPTSSYRERRRPPGRGGTCARVYSRSAARLRDPARRTHTRRTSHAFH